MMMRKKKGRKLLGKRLYNSPLENGLLKLGRSVSCNSTGFGKLIYRGKDCERIAMCSEACVKSRVRLARKMTQRKTRSCMDWNPYAGLQNPSLSRSAYPISNCLTSSSSSETQQA